jgi:hypothetical protein
MIDEDLDMSKLGGSKEASPIKETVAAASSTDEDEDLEFFRGLANS